MSETVAEASRGMIVLTDVRRHLHAPHADIVYLERDAWQSADCVYRQPPYSVTSLPTILKSKAGDFVGRIQDGEILDAAKMKAFMKS